MRSIPRFSSKSKTFTTPDLEPAPNQFSLLLKTTLWTGDVMPEMLYNRYTWVGYKVAGVLQWSKPTMMLFGFPTSHRLTFLSSPPVANMWPLFGLRDRQFTLELWATNSAEKGEENVNFQIMHTKPISYGWSLHSFQLLLDTVLAIVTVLMAGESMIYIILLLYITSTLRKIVYLDRKSKLPPRQFQLSESNNIVTDDLYQNVGKRSSWRPI